MKTSDFDYILPKSLIAQHPIEPRDASRLLVYDKANDKVSHSRFCRIGDFLKRGDLLVVNNTRVIPARLFGKSERGAAFEMLLLRRLDYTRWKAVMRPAKRARAGAQIQISDELSAFVESVGDYGERVLRFEFSGVFEDILSRAGNTPLPPYIKEKLSDSERYQTVYSQILGSAAAPTAGLHFTKKLIEDLKDSGIEFATVLLNIGLGTFRPVKAPNIADHVMHA